MLSSTNHAVLAHVALTLGSMVGMGARALISEDLDLKWRETVVSLSISGDSSYHDHWRLSEIFERDQTLLPLVIERWFDILVATLPLDTRIRLISKIPEEASSSTISGVVEALVSDDLAATQALFGRRGLGTLHRLGLSGEPSASWIARARGNGPRVECT